MSAWKRVLICLGVLIGACALFAWFFGIQTYYAWETHSMARKDPSYWVIPSELPDKSISITPGGRMSYFGYEFEVPWNDIDKEKTRLLGTDVAIIVFHSGNVISIWCKPPHGLVSVLLAGNLDQKGIGEFLGNESIRSDYDLERSILETTPDSFSIFIPAKRAVHLSALFAMKAVTLHSGAESGVFDVKTEEFKGFQFGRPQNPSRRLSVELFNSDRTVEILFGQAPAGFIPISQADINRLVQSLHRDPLRGTVPRPDLQN